MRHIVDLHELGHLGNPAPLHKGDVIRVVVVKRVGGAVREFHAQPEGEGILRAGLAQAFKLLHPGDARQPAGRAEKLTLSLGAGRMLETKNNGVANHGCKERRLSTRFAAKNEHPAYFRSVAALRNRC